MTDHQAAVAWLEDQLDRHGAELDAWADAAAARRARELVLALPEARAALEAARRLDGGLAAAREALDAAILRGGGSGRVLERVMERLPPAPALRLPLRRVAAGMAAAWLIGLGLGVAASTLPTPAPAETLLVEPLVFGPDEPDLS